MSILDTDVYKLTMLYAVWQQHPHAMAKYSFKDRTTSRLYTQEFVNKLRICVQKLRDVRLTSEEAIWLEEKFPMFSTEFLEYLKSYTFNPELVKIDFKDFRLEISVEGTWTNTILFEVPLLSLISELYFEIIDTDWNLDNQSEQARRKIDLFEQNGILFSEFGTRRRRSFLTQEIFIQEMVHCVNRGYKCISGTSNLHFARKFNLNPIGTVAHEWVMATSVLNSDLLHANLNAFNNWKDIYKDWPQMGIALPDTYGIDAFLKDFNFELASWYRGVRHDSGDGFAFMQKMIQHYTSLGIDPKSKVIIFSDALNSEAAIKYKHKADELGIPSSFGIGTYLTNDFKCSDGSLSKPLNIVIKLASIASNSNTKPVLVVKLSDEPGKHHGNAEAIAQAVKVFQSPF
jgi:nicotinate phosphoribosyltransferase